MHPRYAAIFDIENLELNQHYCPQANDQARYFIAKHDS